MTVRIAVFRSHSPKPLAWMRLGSLLTSLLLIARLACSEPGTTALSFLQDPLDARAAGLGGAYSSVAGRLGALQYNPAGLSHLTGHSVTATLMPGPAGGEFGSVAYGLPLGNAVLAAGMNYFNAGTIDLNLSNGQTGTVTAEQDFAIVGGGAYTIMQDLSVGGSIKYVRSTLAQEATASTALFDLGAQYQAPYGIALGAAAQHLGGNIKYESTSDPVPRTYRFGANFRSRMFKASKLDPWGEQNADDANVDFMVAVDGVQVEKQNAVARAGIEMGLQPALVNRIALRFGGVINDSAQSYTFGVGFRHGSCLFDYAFGNQRELQSQHQFTLSVLF